MEKNLEFEGSSNLAELLTDVSRYNEAQKEAFLLLGNVYKSGKLSGYKEGYAAAKAEKEDEAS